MIFHGDNGGPIRQGSPNGAINAPLRGGKGDVYEGGVRVPFVVSWPGRIPAGWDYAVPVSTLDVPATALGLAGVAIPSDKKFDSVDLVPFLSGAKSGAPHERLFWRTSNGQRAVREGTWKLVRLPGQADQLFLLLTDMGERNDLASDRPEVVRRLGEALDAWDRELVPPAFPGLQGRRGANSTGN